MRPLLALAVGAVSFFAIACAEGSDGAEGVAINRGALGGPAAPAAHERYIVGLRDSARGASALHAAGAEVVLALPRHKAVAAHIPPQALQGLSRNPNVEYIEPDGLRRPLAEAQPYGIAMIQADADELSEVPGPVTVCIIDSGLYAAHDDIGELNVTASTNDGTGNPLRDHSGHGTHVAGIIRAIGGNGIGVRGVNPAGALKLHIVKVFGDDGVWAYTSSLVAALDACRNSVTGKLIVSMSLGGSSKSKLEERAFNSAYAAGVLSIAAAGNDGNTALSYPASYGSVMSVAAVDSNRAIADFSQQNAQVEIAAPGVDVLSTVPFITHASITVGATTYQGQSIEFAATSQGAGGVLVYGGLCDSVGSWIGRVVLCDRGTISFYTKVHNAQLGGAVAALIANNAPGGFLGTLGDGFSSTIPAISLSQEDGALLKGVVEVEVDQWATVVNYTEYEKSSYEAWSGTSMATPYVSGVAALVWNKVSNATNAEIREALVMGAVDLDPPGRDNAFGYGLVQALDAYDYLTGGPTCTPSEEEKEVSCSNGQDDDCDGATDGADSDCQNTCDLGGPGDSCTSGGDCCSGSCTGKKGKKTCR